MTKLELLSVINKTIAIGKEKLISSPQPNPYGTALSFLNKIQTIVVPDEQPNKEQAESTSLGLFSIKEVEPYDRKYASALSQVAYYFDKYYDLLDPDFEAIAKELS